MDTYRELLNYGKKELKARKVENAELDAWLLMEFVCKISRSWYFVHGEEFPSKEMAEEYVKCIEKRGRHIPLQQITQEAWFYGLKFFVNENVLAPRQDTETLVEEVLKEAKGRKDLKILDMCTGSGCILLSLLANLENAQGVGADLSEKALEVAERNGREIGGDASWLCTNLFDRVQGVYDIIVSNPPYIETEVIESLMDEVKIYEPRMALDGHEDGLYFYRKISETAGKYLKAQGILAFEIGYNQGEDVRNIMKDCGYSDIRVVKDLAGLDRTVIGKKK